MNTNKQALQDIEKMASTLTLDEARLERLIGLKVAFLKGEISPEAAKEQALTFERITPEEFAMAEQKLSQYGIDDSLLEEKLEALVAVFREVLRNEFAELPPGHPVHTYLAENQKIQELTELMEKLLQGKFILNPWTEIYEKLAQVEIHYNRKENQIFSYLERKGFNKPTSVMWSLDNQIKKQIKTLSALLAQSDENQFLQGQSELITALREMIFKEEEILYPTALEMLTEAEFTHMRKGDDEIGYCLIEKPPLWSGAENGEVYDHQSAAAGEKGKAPDQGAYINLGQGILSIEQLNLIFRHLPVDISFVDENDLVKFYNDTEERIFPRSPGVIGRKVQNCHPKESVDTVLRIVEAFKSGEKSHAEFWLELGGKFLHIQYFAVRDQAGQYRGILEMMQDASHVRSLSGTQRLLSWDEGADTAGSAASKSESSYSKAAGSLVLSGDTKLEQILEVYPFIKPFLIGLNPKFNKLKNEMLFKMMSKIADLEGISKRGDMPLETLIDRIAEEIEKNA